MVLDSSKSAFFELLRAGLWEIGAQLSKYKDINYSVVLKLAEEQSVVGLITAGLEKVSDVKIPKAEVLQFVGKTMQLEQRNIAMNVFVAKLIMRLQSENVYAILVKGQGIAQCYERPLWRACGDVDLLLGNSDYYKAKKILIPLATRVETEYTHFKHQGVTIYGWEVELHGTQHSRLSKRVDDGIDNVQREVFYGGKVRSWINGGAQVPLPAPDEDVIFVFTHILHHFFIEGIGIRQICDWCRLLWTYKDSLNQGLLESRIRKIGLMIEWKTFAVFVVKYLGMPVDAMPFYSADARWERKAERICSFVLEVGNFGHNKLAQGLNASRAQSFFWRKFKSFWMRLSNMCRHLLLFPKDSIVFFGGVLRSGLHAAVRGE